jgi:hypothetical protein
MDPAVLDSFDRVGDLDQLAGCGFRVGVRASGGEFHDAFGKRSKYSRATFRAVFTSRVYFSWM